MKLFLFPLLLIIQIPVLSQSVAVTSSEIYDDLLRLKNDVTVMYIAAHPDDENTKMISWLTHEKHVDAVYLSLTRGDGGQNLIGKEKGELLGLLRTQELLEARSIDKGRQWFTRAVDFGYSKNTEDTFNHWEEEEMLADVVWAVRVNRPEIIITRFHPESNGKTHGHHTASAQLAVKAFDLAGNPEAFPEQLKHVGIWKPKRLFYNTSWWFYGSQEAFDKVDKSNMIQINTGTYFPHLGISNNEIASKSRSSHASQGFGTSLSRGNETEWLQLLKGDMPESEDLFDGINMRWESPKINSKIEDLLQNFNFKNPEKSASNLLELYNLIKKENAHDYRLEKILNLILKCKGIYMEWTTPKDFSVPGEEIPTFIEITNRSSEPLHFEYEGTEMILQQNESFTRNSWITLDSHVQSPAYWLKKPHEKSLYSVENMRQLGMPEESLPVWKEIKLNFVSESLITKVALRQKTVDPSSGEKYQNFYLLPDFVLNFSHSNYLFNGKTKQVSVTITANVTTTKAIVELTAGPGWKISSPQEFQTDIKGEKKEFIFSVTPPENFTQSELKAKITADSGVYSKSLQIVDYPHVRRQIWLPDAAAKIQNIEISIPGTRVAYIHGSGDDVPSSLRQMGVEVDELSTSEWNNRVLENYDVVVLGIRAFNTLPELSYIQEDLWDFVANGGMVIAQYNTSRELSNSKISPIEMKLGRDRIAEENTTLRILEPQHSIFNFPNKITSSDFQNWEQERGLYFAETWGNGLVPMLEGNDKGETPKRGILLVGKYGKGFFVYTGLSFFRELPAGVPGAYRLFMNLLALSENKIASK